MLTTNCLYRQSWALPNVSGSALMVLCILSCYCLAVNENGCMASVRALALRGNTPVLQFYKCNLVQNIPGSSQCSTETHPTYPTCRIRIASLPMAIPLSFGSAPRTTRFVLRKNDPFSTTYLQDFFPSQPDYIAIVALHLHDVQSHAITSTRPVFLPDF